MISLKIITLIVLFCVLGKGQMYGESFHSLQNHEENQTEREIEIVKKKQKIEMKKRRSQDKKRRSQDKEILISEPIGVRRLHHPKIQEAVQAHREKKAREVKEKMERIDESKKFINLCEKAIKMHKQSVTNRRVQLEKAELKNKSQSYIDGISNIIDELKTKIYHDKKTIEREKGKIKELESSITLEEIRDAEEFLGISLLKN